MFITGRYFHKYTVFSTFKQAANRYFCKERFIAGYGKYPRRRIAVCKTFPNLAMSARIRATTFHISVKVFR